MVESLSVMVKICGDVVSGHGGGWEVAGLDDSSDSVQP